MNWKRIGQKLLFPSVWVMIVLTIFSTISLTHIFVKGLEASIVAYVIYVVAFYSLSVVCVFVWKVLPKKYEEIKKLMCKFPIGYRYLHDAAFRTHISLYISLGVNLLYVGINVASFVLYRSMWFVILAVYYIILTVMRFLLVRYVKENEIGKNRLEELKRAILCSYILLLVNFVLSGAVLMILYQNKGVEYQGVLIYVMAAYTFYITTHAIIDLIKYRKYRSPIMSITKIIAFSAALVSMLSLETAMFAQFGQDMDPQDEWLMIVLTGAGVSISVIVMSVYTIVMAKKEMKRTSVQGND